VEGEEEPFMMLATMRSARRWCSAFNEDVLGASIKDRASVEWVDVNELLCDAARALHRLE